jgi:hypothetical protein
MIYAVHQLYLYSDSGSLSGSPTNSQCSVSNAGSDSLSVPFTVTFASSFSGAKTIYAWAQTYDCTSPPTAMGTWTVGGAGTPPPPPPPLLIQSAIVDYYNKNVTFSGVGFGPGRKLF